MQLGENIIQLRTERRLTQEELADLLGVSRQSVSKWESGTSTPELDKLIRLSEVFGVTVDELVKGKCITDNGPPAAADESGAGEAAPQSIPAADGRRASPSSPTRGSRAAGIAYLCLGFLLLLGLTLTIGLSGFVVGFVFSLPFIVCALVCLLVPGKRTGLWCGWALYVLVDGYLRYATGLNWHAIFASIHWTPQMNYMRLFIAWVQFLAAAVLVAATVLSYRRERLILSREGKILYIFGWVALAAVWFGWGLVNQLYWAYVGPNRVGAKVYTVLFLLRDGLFWALLTAMLTASFRLWRTARGRPKENA